MTWCHLTVLGSTLTLGDKLPAGSSYLPPTAASSSYGAGNGQRTYGNDYYDEDYQDQQASYSEPDQASF